jgi:endonuclease/exonuclease/phosphatase family metal-dependent hydrolase
MAAGALAGLALETAAFAGVALLRGRTPLHGASGSDTSAHQATSGARQLRVMTYNVRGLVGGTGDGRKMVALDQVADVVKRYHPDVLVLQEVYDDNGWYGRTDELQELTDALHPSSVAGATTYQHGNGGAGVNAVMTFNGYGISDARGLRLPVGGVASRGATDTMVVSPDGTPIRVVGTHLSFDGGFGDEVHALAGELQATSDGTPTIVAGDFNAQSESSRGKLQHAAFQAAGLHDAQATLHAVDRDTTTFPSHPGADIDRIYASGLTPTSTHVATDARGVSDHVPVIADFTVPDARQ